MNILDNIKADKKEISCLHLFLTYSYQLSEPFSHLACGHGWQDFPVTPRSGSADGELCDVFGHDCELAGFLNHLLHQLMEYCSQCA